MPLYEHVFIARQDISGTQAENLIQEFSQIITDNGGNVVGTEYWGLRSMAYKINKNRKGHYAMMRTDAPPAAVQEMERLVRLHEDVMRCLTVRVDEHDEGPSAVMQAKAGRDDRRGGGGGRRRGPRDDEGDGPRDRDSGPRDSGSRESDTKSGTETKADA